MFSLCLVVVLPGRLPKLWTSAENLSRGRAPGGGKGGPAPKTGRVVRAFLLLVSVYDYGGSW